jgi:glycosyltransferase involved in cell wall biosynthesis
MLPAGSPEAPRLRILQVILSTGFAGSERAVVEACNALCAGQDVGLVVRRDHRSPGGASICDPLDPRVTLFEVPARWRTGAALSRVIEQWQPDVIHTHLRRGTRLVASLRGGRPHVATMHLSLNGPHYLQADTLVCVSRWQEQAVVAAGYRGRLLHIPNSLVPQPRLSATALAALRRAAGAAEADFLIGGVGRLTAGKGFDVLIDAFRTAALPASRLVIVGEGAERRSLARRSRGIDVIFTGFRPDAKDWFQAFDLFVSPSLSEPFGRVIIEALDAGTPVVATDTLGPSEIARDYPVEIVPAGSVPELALALRRVHGRPRTRMRVDLGEFHVDRIAGRLLEAYRAPPPAPLPDAHGRAAA